MNDENDETLPILDLSSFPVVAPPGEFFKVVDPHTDEEAFALDDLLGVPELVKEFFSEARRKRGKKKGVQIMIWLHAVAQTPELDIVAVHFKLTDKKTEGMTT
jgi:hypothetical protein